MTPETKKRLAIGGCVLAVAVLAACGGGHNGSNAPGIPAVPTNTPAPSGQSFANTNAVAIPVPSPGATSVPVALASDTTGASANAALPPSVTLPTDATITVTYSSTADPSLPVLSNLRAPQSVSVSDEVKKNALAFLKLQFSHDISLPQAPGFTFTVPGTVATTGTTYWLAFYDPLRHAAGWQKAFEGPATVTPATVNGKVATQFTFASNNQPLSFVAHQTYWFAVVALVKGTASPTPVPTSIPTNPPAQDHPAKVVATPPNVQFASTTDKPVTVTFSEAGYTGPFKLHGNCTGVVNTAGASPTWTLTPVGTGRCVVIGVGDRGASAVVHVGVATPFETPHPRPSPTATPSTSPRPSPSASPSTSPSGSPRPSPSASPSTSPSGSPRPSPTATPSTSPSGLPKPTPTPSPTPFH